MIKKNRINPTTSEELGKAGGRKV